MSSAREYATPLSPHTLTSLSVCVCKEGGTDDSVPHDIQYINISAVGQ